ncbi:MAG: transposase [Actinobacteria bacterium]|nr:transposase [Actinomycetota bacterium]
MIRADGAGGTKDFTDWLTRRGVQYSVGFTLPFHTPDLLKQIPTEVWTPAYDADGQVRRGAYVAELTDLLDLASVVLCDRRDIRAAARSRTDHGRALGSARAPSRPVGSDAGRCRSRSVRAAGLRGGAVAGSGPLRLRRSAVRRGSAALRRGAQPGGAAGPHGPRLRRDDRPGARHRRPAHDAGADDGAQCGRGVAHLPAGPRPVRLPARRSRRGGHSAGLAGRRGLRRRRPPGEDHDAAAGGLRAARRAAPALGVGGCSHRAGHADLAAGILALPGRCAGRREAASVAGSLARHRAGLGALRPGRDHRHGRGRRLLRRRRRPGRILRGLPLRERDQYQPGRVGAVRDGAPDRDAPRLGLVAWAAARRPGGLVAPRLAGSRCDGSRRSGCRRCRRGHRGLTGMVALCLQRLGGRRLRRAAGCCRDGRRPGGARSAAADPRCDRAERRIRRGGPGRGGRHRLDQPAGRPGTHARGDRGRAGRCRTRCHGAVDRRSAAPGARRTEEPHPAPDVPAGLG